MNSAEHTRRLLTTYLRRLTNLTGNNRSIFLPRLIGEQIIDLQELSFLNGESAFKIIEALLGLKQKIICPVLDARMEASNIMSRKLKKLQRLEQFIFEEKGARDLHIGWPIVEGKFKDGTLVRCPLLYFPVTIESNNLNWVLRLRHDTNLSFNKSFLLAYAYYNHLKPCEELLEEDFEELEADSTLFRTRLYRLLNQYQIEINFNADNYRDELIPFNNVKKDEFEDHTKTGELKLFPQAVLGIFPQAGSNLVPDYLQLIEHPEFQDLEDFFHVRSSNELRPSSLNFLNHIKEEKIHPIFPMDIWQENALKAARIGHSLVVQGPPGTGKSQLICNLISDAISAGKRILVVCQKRVALDVVYNRLSTHFLGDYLALVHDFKTDRKAIYYKLASQIEKVDEYRQKNISLDSIQLERKYLQLCHRIDQVVEELEVFRHNLFDESECGTAIKNLYLQSNPATETIHIKQEFHQFKFDELNNSMRKLTRYLNYAVKFNQSEYALKERKSFSAFNQLDLQAIIHAIEDVSRYFHELTDSLHKNFGVQLDLSACEQILEKQSIAKDLNILLKDEVIYSFFQQMVPESEEETSSLWLSNVEKNLMSCFEGDGPEVSTPNSQLGQLQKALYRSMKARRSLFGLIRWELFSKDKFLIKRTLVANSLKSNKAGFTILEKKLDNRLNVEHLITKLREKSWLLNIPESVNQKDFMHWFANQHFALNAKKNLNELRGVKHFIDPTKLTLSEFHLKLDQLFSWISTIEDHKVHWINYLTSAQIEFITRNPTEVKKIISTVKQDFEELCDFDNLSENLTVTEKSVINKLHEKTGSWQPEIIIPLLLNSLSLTWIEHLETKHPELRMVSSGKINSLENELRDLYKEKQALSEEIVLLRARENVVDEMKFNRLNNRVTYRDLHHQVTKKKKIWPVRKLMTEYPSEVFKLIPCWLASPESVSAIFPMTDLFDLVIFDEASQCYAEQGIPSLYRGKQVIVAGDALQLRPGDFYQTRWQDEEFDHPDIEVDSLLDLTSRYLMPVQLKGHYRSKTPELIAFSNHYFYKNSLQFLPDRLALSHQYPVMQYEKLDGVWENNTNLAEAHRVVELVVTISKEKPHKEIGIITFNAPQQLLILDLLEEIFANEQRNIPETIFVKNIENVQGDESDVIIFSIAYAPDSKGHVNAQFGSLNLAGGENRLNVAVSRARERIILVTSLWPEQLHVENSLNEGPKLLKKYLQFVLKVSREEYHPEIFSPTHKPLTLNIKSKIKKYVTDKWPEYELDETYLPYFDFVVKKNKIPLGIIFTDDHYYFQSLSVKAEHALYPQLLETKHWPFIRLYTRNWWSDPEKFQNEIGKFLSQLN